MTQITKTQAQKLIANISSQLTYQLLGNEQVNINFNMMAECWDIADVIVRDWAKKNNIDIIID